MQWKSMIIFQTGFLELTLELLELRFEKKEGGKKWMQFRILKKSLIT